MYHIVESNHVLLFQIVSGQACKSTKLFQHTLTLKADSFKGLTSMSHRRLSSKSISEGLHLLLLGTAATQHPV